MVAFQPISLTFSQEEVVLLLKLFGAPTIPGLGEDPLAGLPKEHVQLILSSAERSLKARQILSVATDGKITIDRLALALLGPCVTPEFSLIANRTRRNNLPETLYFHAAQAMKVEHAITGPGLHAFTALNGQEILLDRLGGFLNLDSQPAQEDISGNILANILRDAIQAFEQGSPAMTAVLQGGGASTGLANALGSNLETFVAISAVVAIRHLPEGKMNMQRFAFLDCETALWELGSTEDDQVFHLNSISAEQAKGKIKEMIADE
jgi:hypothetical protein